MISEFASPQFPLAEIYKSVEQVLRAIMESSFYAEMSDPQSATLWGATHPESYKAITVQSTSTPTTPPYSQSLALESQMLGVPSTLQGALNPSCLHTTVITGSQTRQPVCALPHQLPMAPVAKRNRTKNFIDPCDIAPLKKRRIQVELLDAGERDKVLQKREKNKVAAEKCRVKRREKVQQTRAEYDDYLESNEALEAEIRKLKEEKQKLQELMDNHHCVSKLKA